MIDEEVWKDIPDYPYYQASSAGRLRVLDRPVKHSWCKNSVSIRKGRILKPSKGTSGYYCVAISKDGVKKNKMVHCLVALAFLGPKGSNQVVDHLNSDRADNSIGNLEYVSVSENNRRTYARGRTSRAGEASPTARLSQSAVDDIRKRRGTASDRELAEEYKVSPQHIRSIWRGVCWRE